MKKETSSSHRFVEGFSFVTFEVVNLVLVVVQIVLGSIQDGQFINDLVEGRVFHVHVQEGEVGFSSENCAEHHFVIFFSKIFARRIVDHF